MRRPVLLDKEIGLLFSCKSPKKIGKLRDPEGICIINDLIFVADKGNHRVQIFNYKGHFSGQLGSYSGREDGIKFDTPTLISTFRVGVSNLVVADKVGIHVFSPDLALVRTLNIQVKSMATYQDKIVVVTLCNWIMIYDYFGCGKPVQFRPSDNKLYYKLSGLVINSAGMIIAYDTIGGFATFDMDGYQLDINMNVRFAVYGDTFRGMCIDKLDNMFSVYSKCKDYVTIYRPTESFFQRIRCDSPHYIYMSNRHIFISHRNGVSVFSNILF